MNNKHVRVRTMLSKLRKNRRGIIGLIAGLVIAMVVVGVILMVGLQVSASFQTTSATTNYGSAANNATAALVFTNTFAGYNLMALLPYIIAAGAIISVVLVVLLSGFGRKPGAGF
jgi:tetrahydromethanopterin S-methyltransferase subunit F